MPKIPVYDPYQVQQQVRPGVRFDAPSGPGPGQIAGEQMQQFGQQVERAGGEFAQMILEQQQRTNELRVLEQYNSTQRQFLELEEEIRQNRGGAVNQTFGQEGEETIGFVEYYGNRAQEIIVANQDQLVSDDAKIRFNELTVRLGLQMQDNLLKHYERENLVWEKSVVEDAVIVASQAIASHPTDSLSVGGSVMTMRSAIEQQLKATGITDPVARAERTRLIMSSSLKDILLNLAADDENGGIEKAQALFSILTASENEALTADDINSVEPVIEGGNAIVIGRAAARQIHDEVGWSVNQTVDVDRLLREFTDDDGEPLTEKELDAARIEINLLRGNSKGRHDANQARLATEVARIQMEYGNEAALQSTVFGQLDPNTQVTLRSSMLSQDDAERRRETERLNQEYQFRLYGQLDADGRSMFDRLAEVTDQEINALMPDIGFVNIGKLRELRDDARSAGSGSTYRGMTANLSYIKNFANQHSPNLHAVMTYQGPSPSGQRLKAQVTDALESAVRRQTELFKEANNGRGPNVAELDQIMYAVFNDVLPGLPTGERGQYRVPVPSASGQAVTSQRKYEQGGGGMPSGIFPVEQQLTAATSDQLAGAGASIGRLEAQARGDNPDAAATARSRLNAIVQYQRNYLQRHGQEISREQALLAMRREAGQE